MNKKSPSSLFDFLKGNSRPSFTIESQRQSLGLGPLSAPQTTPHEQSTDTIAAIQQKNSKGFRVIDINPNNCDRASFYPSLNQQDLVELLGPENCLGSAGAEFEDGSGDFYSTLPYWRTVQLSISGNFFKVEFLPARINDDHSNIGVAGVSQITDNTKVSGASDDGTDFSAKHATDKIFLIQFEDNTSTPLIAKHGDSFKTDFTNVYISFKQNLPRFRITIGSNSEIANVDDRSANMQIAYGPGYGLFNNPVIHPVSFCITDRDLNSFQAPAGFVAGQGVFGGSGSSFGADLIQNIPTVLNRCYVALGTPGSTRDLSREQWLNSAGANTSYTSDQTLASCNISGGAFQANNNEQNGMAIGWITGFTANIGASIPAAYAGSQVEVILEIIEYSTNFSSISIVKRLASVSAMVSGGGNGSVSLAFLSAPLKESIRFCLLQSQALRILIINTGTEGVGISAFTKFSITGYFMGRLSGLGTSSGFAVAPFAPAIKFTENPYPMDQATSNMPRF